MNRICAGFAGLLLFTLARSQTPEPAFAVASIKPNESRPFGNPRFGLVEFKSGGRLTATAASVYVLVKAAYGLSTERIGKGPKCPDWAVSQRFDVEAVAEEGTIPERLDSTQLRERMQPLLQRLLAERYGLVIRRVPKEMPVYELTVAKSGAKLTEAPISAEECRTSYDCHRILGDRLRGLHGSAVTMGDLAFALEKWSDRPIINATGIEGLFALEVRPYADMKPILEDFPESLPEKQRPPPEPFKPSLSSILEKDLGLLLVHGRAQIETIQIESVSRPSPN